MIAIPSALNNIQKCQVTKFQNDITSCDQVSVRNISLKLYLFVTALQNGRSEELTRMSSGFFKNRKTAARRSARVSSKQSSTSSEPKKVHPSPQLTLRPLFFEVPSTDNQGCFSGRQWLMRDMEKSLESSSSGIFEDMKTY